MNAQTHSTQDLENKILNGKPIDGFSQGLTERLNKLPLKLIQFQTETAKLTLELDILQSKVDNDKSLSIKDKCLLYPRMITIAKTLGELQQKFIQEGNEITRLAMKEKPGVFDGKIILPN